MTSSLCSTRLPTCPHGLYLPKGDGFTHSHNSRSYSYVTYNCMWSPAAMWRVRLRSEREEMKWCCIVLRSYSEIKWWACWRSCDRLCGVAPRGGVPALWCHAVNRTTLSVTWLSSTTHTVTLTPKALRSCIVAWRPTDRPTDKSPFPVLPFSDSSLNSPCLIFLCELAVKRLSWQQMTSEPSMNVTTVLCEVRAKAKESF